MGRLKEKIVNGVRSNKGSAVKGKIEKKKIDGRCENAKKKKK